MDTQKKDLQVLSLLSKSNSVELILVLSGRTFEKGSVPHINRSEVKEKGLILMVRQSSSIATQSTNILLVKEKLMR